MLRSLKNAPTAFQNLGKQIKLPEKFKGTIVEKWANYWKNLFIDYRQMVHDLRTDIQDDPRKAIKWTAALTAAYVLCRNNPNEHDFRDSLRRIKNEAILVSDECLNKKAIGHIRYLDQCYNEGVIHYKNFGLASVMYVSDYNNSCSLFKAQCDYTKPSYFDLPSKIVDVGIMGRWWNVFVKTANYDVYD